MAGHYTLHCSLCHNEFEDDGLTLTCHQEHEAALLRANYTHTHFSVQEDEAGIYRYQQWLPVTQKLSRTAKPVTFQSERLSRITGLPHLWISFNGYWPERGAFLETCTFKELEAYTVLSRLPVDFHDVLVVSSAGNTASAFAYTCSQNKIPCLIIIPESGLSRMQFTDSLDGCVKIVCLTGFVDYYDAILFSTQVAQYDGFVLEGGVKNIARRDGLGITLLDAVDTIGQLPDYYCQAIGSGAGAIAVHHTAHRFMADGRFGNRYPHLLLSQNIPFAPIYRSWKQKQRCLVEMERDLGKKQIQQIAAQVLSNQAPPYAIIGGVFDVLTESGGDMLAADNSATYQAMKIFEEAEGIDIDPAAGVAFASLLQEVEHGRIDADASVLLNITGGGLKRKQQAQQYMKVRPSLSIHEDELTDARSVEKVLALFH
ncbi:MAG TPA: cysteate synthase [Ktedonobacteraceae bacterium]|nr:cysteate synthase [Ktedonobacteraceae bacterium]